MANSNNVNSLGPTPAHHAISNRVAKANRHLPINWKVGLGNKPATVRLQGQGHTKFSQVVAATINGNRPGSGHI